MTTTAIQNKAGGKKTLKKRKLTDVFVDEVSFVDYPAVPGARFLLMKRDNISEAVQKVLDEINALPKDEIEQIIRLTKGQYDAADISNAGGGGGVEPETTAEEHVQALVDMLDDLPEAALDHVVALADKAGIEMDDLPAVQGGDADQYDSIPTPQGANGASGKPQLSDALGAIHDHVQQTADMPDEVKDAMAIIHGYVSGGQSPGIATDAEEGDPGAEQDQSDEDNPGDTTGEKGPTDQDGQDKGKINGNLGGKVGNKPGNKPEDKANPKGPIAKSPPKRRDDIPGATKSPIAPPKSAVSGTPGKRRDPRVLAMLQRRTAKRDELAAAAAAQEPPNTLIVLDEQEPADFWTEIGQKLTKREQDAQLSETDRLNAALDRVLDNQIAELNRLEQLESKFERAGCKA